MSKQTKNESFCIVAQFSAKSIDRIGNWQFECDCQSGSMSSVRLHELRINAFNKLQDQTVRWNQGVVEESQDLHIIAVRDFIGKWPPFASGWVASVGME